MVSVGYGFLAPWIKDRTDCAGGQGQCNPGATRVRRPRADLALARCAQQGLIEGEAAGAEVRGEGLAFGLGGGLAGFVFGPAVEIGVAEGFGGALLVARRRIAGGAAAVVGVNVAGERGVVVAVGVEGYGERQAHTDKALGGGIAEAQPGDWKDLVGQFQDLGDGAGVVADDADRAAAEAGGLG